MGTATANNAQKKWRVIKTSGSDAALKREFERLYLESYSLVFNYVSYRMADTGAAEDVVAEAFMLAARAFDRFDPTRSKFSTWVISIAVNCMRTYYRKHRPTTTLDDVPESVAAVSGEQGDVDNRLYIQQLLGVLSEEEREIILMKYQEGLRNVDIAEQLDMNASTVSTKLSNALKKMRVAADRSDE